MGIARFSSSADPRIMDLGAEDLGSKGLGSEGLTTMVSWCLCSWSAVFIHLFLGFSDLMGDWGLKALFLIGDWGMFR